MLIKIKHFAFASFQNVVIFSTFKWNCFSADVIKTSYILTSALQTYRPFTYQSILMDKVKYQPYNFLIEYAVLHYTI